MPDRAVNRCCQIFLSLPVRIGKNCFANGCFSLCFPFQLHLCPFLIDFCQMRKPLLQLAPCIAAGKAPYFLCIQIGIGHLYSYLFQILLFCIDTGITSGLCQMNRIWLFHSLHISKNAFDFINYRLSILFKDPVCPSFYYQQESVTIYLCSQRYFRMIICPHLSLNLPVQSAAHLHGIFICHRTSSVVNISAAQNKLHQIAHRYSDFFHVSPVSFQNLLLFIP